MKKVTGFKMLSAEGLFNAFELLCDDGTCVLAYENIGDLLIPVLLDGDYNLLGLRATEGKCETRQDEWSSLDQEIIEALIMLPVMRNLCVAKLYWCTPCGKISTEEFICKHDPELTAYNMRFGLDFTGEDCTLDWNR